VTRRYLLAMLAVAFSIAACKHGAEATASTAEADSTFEPSGRILVNAPIRAPSASFDGNRVIGPAINVSRRPDGTWAGWIRGQAVNLEVKGNQISDASLTLNVHELPEGVEVRGLWVGGPRSGEIDIRVTPTEFYAREPHIEPPIFLEAAGPGRYGRGAFANAIGLEGDAALPHPPEPQFALALLGGL